MMRAVVSEMDRLLVEEDEPEIDEPRLARPDGVLARRRPPPRGRGRA